MDLRQAKKWALLLASINSGDIASSTFVEAFLKGAGVTDAQDIGRVRTQLRNIATSLSLESLTMKATGGGGTQFDPSVFNTAAFNAGIVTPAVTPSVANAPVSVVASANLVSVGNITPALATSVAPTTTPVVPTSTLTEWDDDELKVVVEAYVDSLVSDEETFTAYDVTKAIQVDYPTVNIRHYRVRDLVHAYMGTIPTYGAGQSPNFPALEYSPIVGTLTANANGSLTFSGVGQGSTTTNIGAQGLILSNN